MKLKTILIAIAAAVGAFVVSSARAQTETNIFALSVTLFQQGPTNTVNGTNTAYGPTVVATHTTIQLIQNALGPDFGATFSSAAKLAMTNGTFVVIDGTKVVDVSSVISLNFPGTNRITSGVINGQTSLAFPTKKEMELIELSFDDSSAPNPGDLKFSVFGLVTGTTTDSVPSNGGIYTETFSATVVNLVGEGSDNHGPFVATGKLTVSRKGALSL